MKIIIIGAGPGGYETAVEAAKRGVEVVLIESGEVGGTCLNEGCIPTKTLCTSAALYENVKRAGEFGIELPEGAKPDFAKVQERRRTVVEQLRAGVQSLLRGPLIKLVHGR
ncbi:MAG: FAD-dependent oxidoreductase, partial [Bacteroidales bacterium]|nr:FAD-dependent oxidoreductase [Bacteroidales bacterium]